MCGSFLLVGPSLWRALFPIDRPIAAGRRHRASSLYAGRRRGGGPRRRPRAAGLVGIGHDVPDDEAEPRGVCRAVLGRRLGARARHRARGAPLGVRARAPRRSQREADHAQLLALRSHLDPHFLFNTLNAIAEWCREDGEVAEQAILQLSSMLRTMMTGISTTTWPLAKRDRARRRALRAPRDPRSDALHGRARRPDPIPESRFRRWSSCRSSRTR